MTCTTSGDFAILKLVHNTSELSLIWDGRNVTGINLEEWMPSFSAYKGGGTYRNSPFSDGQQLLHRVWEYPVETMSLTIRGTSSNNAIIYLRRLIAILEKAANYWAGLESYPVYLVARSAGETRERYALLASGQLDKQNNPYKMPFGGLLDGGAVIETTIAIVRAHWSDVAPGSYAEIPMSNYMDFNGMTFGAVDDTETPYEYAGPENIYATAGGHGRYNLTDIYYYDSTYAGYSVNLLTLVPPYNLLPNPPVVGDIIYFGSSTAINTRGTIHNIVLDLQQGLGASTTGVWEHYSSGAWTTITAYSDATSDLKNTGVGAFSGNKTPAGSTVSAVSVNGVTAYWLRFRVTGVTGVTVPIQQNRHPYTVTWPYVTIPASSIGGDLLSKLNLGVEFFGQANPYLKLHIASRSTVRGEDFTPFINLSSLSDHNPTNFAVTTGAGGAFLTDDIAPCNRLWYVSGGTAGYADHTFTVTFNQAALQYYGTFRVFVRARSTATAGVDNRIRFTITNGSTTVLTSDETVLSGGSDMDIIDLGVITFPGANTSVHDPYPVIKINGDVYYTSGWVQVVDIVMFPVDEMYVELDTTGNFLELYSIENNVEPRQGVRLYVGSVAAGSTPGKIPSGSTIATPPLTAYSHFGLQPNTKQRLFFFLSSVDGTLDVDSWNDSVLRVALGGSGVYKGHLGLQY